jgi:hydroxymethylpyrimidine/phosphomethylpyrimidine kinase
MQKWPAVLVIAGTDSSGGAGLVRDAQVLADCRARALGVVTAVTAQTHGSLRATHHVSPELVRAQMLAALESERIAVIKIGMLGSRGIVQAVLDTLPDRAAVPIVLDPVLASSSGSCLLDEAGLALLREALLPRVTLVTPNIPEAALLLGTAAALDEAGRLQQALELLRLGPQAVLLKGGHGAGQTVVDILLTSDQTVVRNAVPRVAGAHRGTGCALASAIAAEIAAGRSLADACRNAQAYLFAQLSAAAAPSMTG